MNPHFDLKALILVAGEGQDPSPEQLEQDEFFVRDVRMRSLGKGANGKVLSLTVYDVVNPGPQGGTGLIFLKRFDAAEGGRHLSQLQQSKILACRFRLIKWLDLLLLDAVGEFQGEVPLFAAIALSGCAATVCAVHVGGVVAASSVWQRTVAEPGEYELGALLKANVHTSPFYMYGIAAKALNAEHASAR